MLCPYCKCLFPVQADICPRCGRLLTVPDSQRRKGAQKKAVQSENRLNVLLSVLLTLNLTLSAIICTALLIKNRTEPVPGDSTDSSSKPETVKTTTAATVTTTTAAAATPPPRTDDAETKNLDACYLPEGLHFFMTQDEANAVIYSSFSPLNDKPQTEISLTGTPICDYFFDAPPAGFGKTAAAFSDCPVRLQLYFDNSEHTLTQINLESECSYTDDTHWGCFGTEASAAAYQQRALKAVTGFPDDPQYVEYPFGIKNGNQHQYRFSNSAGTRMLGVCYHAYDMNTTAAYYSYWCYDP